MGDNAEKTAEDLAAFQKLWADSITKLLQAAFIPGQESLPPEMLRQMRTGIFQALAQSWEEFMRSPQFLDGMKQWMDSALNFRKLSNDFLAKVRNDFQAPSRDDVDTVMLAVRHMEKRLLDRLEDLAKELSDLKSQVPKGKYNKQVAKPKRTTTQTSRRRSKK